MTSGKGRQLVLALPHRTALGRDDFLVSPANAAAVAMIDQWPDWPSHALLLVGPPGSGKSHLVEVWRQASGAARIAADDLDEAAVPELLSSGNLAIEDAPGPALNERALFHLLNLARQQGARVLITAQRPPGLWGVTLPDLQSRLRAAPVAELGAADDPLLRGVLVKLFADRQLAVEESVISYLVVRMPRSLDAARHLVAEIDRRALEDKAQISRVLVARVLSALAEPGLFPED
jgi:chromosomal replication initiation ATPase DnaA